MTEPSGWLGIGVTIAAYLVGGAIFVGVVKTSIASLTKALDRLEKRMDNFDGFSTSSQVDDARFVARLEVAEREAGAALAGFQALGKDLADFRGECRTDHTHSMREMESLKRGQANHARQLANIMTNRRQSAVYEFGPTEDEA